jgi:PHD/YefM family antitoxin component YafN of YafNO toxin-antitoxin module
VKTYQAADARLKMRDILDEVQRDEVAAITILRHDKPVAIVVSPEWFSYAEKILSQVHLMLDDQADKLEWESGMTALRDVRSKAGLAARRPAVNEEER